MLRAIKKEGEKLYTVFSFAGLIRWYQGKETVKYISLEECLNERCSGTVKDFFDDRGLYFDGHEMSISDIRDNISRGFVVFAISSTVKLKEVEDYVKAGFNVLFMRAKEYNAMRKEY